MLEEVTMEKKLNRSVQSPKGSAETKKNQDVAVGKLFPKSSRKREKPGTKVEQFTKKQGNSSQKSKHNGRKSIARSSHHESGGKNPELAGLDDDFDLRGSKKRNLTHLLNFHCKPREGAVNSSRRSAPKELFHNTIRNLMSTQKHKYNKEQFLQANCQFVVKNGAEYSIHLADPDILVDWNLIEQILVASSEPVTCPICLDFPSAGKITRCGHIYCWSCILHYLALTDKSWHKCPICFEAVHNKDLKSVKLVNQKLYNIGDEITFQLMRREQGTTVAIPISEVTSRIPGVLLPVSGNSHSIVYSKLLLGDYENILKIIETEDDELRDELKEQEGCPEICFVEQAIELLNQRRVKLFEEVNKKVDENNSINVSGSSSMPNKECCTPFEPVCTVTSQEFEGDKLNINNGSDREECSTHQIVPENGLTMRTRCESVRSDEDMGASVTAEDLEININPSATPIKEFFFYQVEDGQQIFLHSINVRILERQFGSLERGPSLIRGKIVENETGSMTEELRKRLRYLQHLPITCQFQVVEIEFLEPAIEEEILISFKDQLEKRTRQREKRAKEEKRLEKKVEQLVKKQYGGHSSPPRRLRLDSHHHFPECGALTPPNMSPRNQSPISSRASSPLSTTSRRSISPVTKALNSLTVNNNTFAQKLKETNKDGVWRKRTTVSESETSCSHSRNLISDAVEVALIKAQLERKCANENLGKNKKKKKQKPTPLCSVGMVYSNR